MLSSEAEAVMAWGWAEKVKSEREKPESLSLAALGSRVSVKCL